MKRKFYIKAYLKQYWFFVTMALVVVYVLLYFFLFQKSTRDFEHTVTENVAHSRQRIEDSLSTAEGFLYESLFNSSQQLPAIPLRVLSSTCDPLDLAVAQSSTLSAIQSLLSWSDCLDFVLIHVQNTTLDNDYWIEIGNDYNYQLRQTVKSASAQDFSVLHVLNDTNAYVLYQQSGISQVFRILTDEHCTILAAISHRAMLQKLDQVRLATDSIAFISDADGSIFAHSALPGLQQLATVPRHRIVRLGLEDYLTTIVVSEKSGLQFGMLTPMHSILREQTLSIIIFLLLLSSMALFVILFYRVISHHIVEPLVIITRSMNQFSEDFEPVDESFKSQELSFLAANYNSMREQIQQLKIEKYEAQLEAQKTSLQYLQMQIRPHFYANVLNLIYALAEQKDYDRIKELSDAITRYSRYRFQDPVQLVELEKELNHVKAYKVIQDIRYQGNITFAFDIEEKALTALIPPFIIQNFIENSVKHAYSDGIPLTISLKVHLDYTTDQLVLTISDNGPGYSPEVLARPWAEKSEAGHLGLSNVHLRLEYIFEENFAISLKNDNGAVAQIHIPFISAELDML
ncbi:MAG: histidine kinase [Treponemataceae bacterium]|nr:histidine kinase [Treponemataceae bacterium]